MNIALFFEGTGQGVRGRKTNVSLLCEECVTEGQRVYLAPGVGTHIGYFLSGATSGRDWRKIINAARTWFETTLKSVAAEIEGRHKIFLFGFSRGALLARHFAAWLNKKSFVVEYMGLWDTVDAIPDLEVTKICPKNVKYARHAVAENEARRFYEYIPLEGLQVEERLFPGSHSDVGGLYDDNHEFADAARAWIAQAAQERGLKLATDAFSMSPVCSSPTAIRHDSQRHISNLFGLLSPVQRVFPAMLRRISDAGVRVIVSLGSNIEPRRKNLKSALEALANLPKTRLVRESTIIETEPEDVPAEYKDQKFLNQVAVFETELSAEDFSDRMHSIEDALGRKRSVRNGPRTIDLDLIDFGGLIHKTKDLILPHPRAHLRDFVLKPMREIGAKFQNRP